MKVFGSTKKNHQKPGIKSDKTTAINSKNNSTKNSSFLTISKESEPISCVPKLFIKDSEVLPHKKGMNVTISKIKPIQIQTQRFTKQEKKVKILGFNFCQQIPNEENFYTKIIDEKEFREKQIQTARIVNMKARQISSLRERSSTLTGPRSPINKLDEFDNEKLEESFYFRELTNQLQFLLDQL